MPTGNGMRTINQIGAPNASVIDPNDTTEAPMIIAARIEMLLFRIMLPKK
jgi:hypothetical protein